MQCQRSGDTCIWSVTELRCEDTFHISNWIKLYWQDYMLACDSSMLLVCRIVPQFSPPNTVSCIILNQPHLEIYFMFHPDLARCYQRCKRRWYGLLNAISDIEGQSSLTSWCAGSACPSSVKILWVSKTAVNHKAAYQQVCACWFLQTKCWVNWKYMAFRQKPGSHRQWISMGKDCRVKEKSWVLF
jgi:hypothetical protein